MNAKINIRLLSLLRILLLMVTESKGKILRHGIHFDVAFAIVKDHHKLKAEFMISSFSLGNVVDCVKKCVRHKDCQSINYNHEKSRCQILNETLSAAEERIESSRGWAYYETDRSAKTVGPYCNDNSPCKDWEVCEDTYTYPPYQCVCQEDFSGDKCQNYEGPGSARNKPALTCHLLKEVYMSSLRNDYYWLKEKTDKPVFCNFRKEADLGKKDEAAILSCRWLHKNYPGMKRGFYWSKNCPAGKNVIRHCDQGLNDTEETKDICEREEESLSCPLAYQKITILHAKYGRSSKHICTSSISSQNTICDGNDSTEKAKGICDGKSNCTLLASNTVFGAPCPGIKKYLEVKFKCSRDESEFRCTWNKGYNSESEDNMPFSEITGKACVDKCVQSKLSNESIKGKNKQLLQRINGVVINENTCWCRMGMTSLRKDNDGVNACFLYPVDDLYWDGKKVEIIGAAKKLVKGELAKNIPAIGKEYRIKFEVYLESGDSETRFIIRFKAKKGRESFKYPVIVTLHDNVLGFLSMVNGDNSYKFDDEEHFKEGEWIMIEVSQVKQCDGNYLYSIKIEGEEVHSLINTEPESFSDVKVIASGQRNKPAHGQIRKLYLYGTFKHPASTWINVNNDD